LFPNRKHTERERERERDRERERETETERQGPLPFLHHRPAGPRGTQ
jgi:hypothetical protein